MTHHASAEFWSCHRALPRELRQHADRCFSLLGETPPQSFVFVRRIDGPALWLQRGSRTSPALRRLLDERFDVAGAFRGDPAADFPSFLREARRHRDLVVSNEALDMAAHRAWEQEERSRRADVSRRVLECGPRIPGIRAELYPYQAEGVAFLAAAGRGILADDMGLGKTLQAIAACRWLVDDGGVERVLVVCPASLKHQWEREIAKFAGEEAVVVQGPAPERRQQYRRRARFTIANYELALRDGQAVRELAPDVLVLDEAQRIKNWRTKTAEAIKSLESRFAFVLTGTPIENRLDDLYSLMQVVDRRVLGPLWAFNERYVEVVPGKNQVRGYRNLRQLREVLRPVFLRRDRERVLTQLPARVDNRYYVELTETQRELMNEHLQQALMILARAKKRPLTPDEERRVMALFTQARRACDAAELAGGETRGSPKLDEFARVLEEICVESRRKVVVFSEWEGMLRLAAERARRLGIEPILFTGKVPTAKRGALIDRFREDPDALAFFSTDAGGVGLNLQVAPSVINLDLPWNPARLEQRISRVHRLGQPRSVSVVLLIAENSLETRIEKLLEEKRDLFRSVVSQEGGEDDLATSPRTMQMLREMLEGGDGAAAAAPVEVLALPAPAELLAPAGVGEPAAAPAPETVPAPVAVPASSPAPATVTAPDIAPAPTRVPAPATPAAERVPMAAPPANGAEVARLEDALGYRLRRVERTRAGRLVAVVDRHDADADRLVREAAGDGVHVLDPTEARALAAFGDDSPLAGAETVLERPAAAAADPRASELERVARRRLDAARRLAEADLGAEALVQAHAAMLARVRAMLGPEREATEEGALLRALYETLLPEGKATLEDAGALGRAGDLCRVYADRDAAVPAALLARTLTDAERFVEAAAGATV